MTVSISLNYQSSLAHTFDIRVFINQQLNHDWYYEPSENRVYFDVIPAGDSLVEVGYLYHESEDSGDTGTP